MSLRCRSPDAPEVVGLKSPANLIFAENLSCYARVLPYDALSMLAPDNPAVCVDFSGT